MNENELSRLRAYAADALRILERSLGLVAAGETAFYRVAALQLRLLLCDSTRLHNQMIDTALLPRVAPGLRLLALDPHGQALDGCLQLDAWLEQELVIGAGRMSVRQLIRRVCDQDGGAHVDVRGEELPEEARGVLARIGGVVLMPVKLKGFSNTGEPV